MHGRTAILLFLVVAALAGGIWWQVQQEQATQIEGDRALVLDIQAARVDRIRVDNLERSVQVTLERDETNAWSIVDPIDYPAAGPLVNQILELVSTQRAYPVRDPDLELLSLAPPRVVLELEQDISGERLLNRLEFGAVDLDGQHGFVRVDGVVLRTLRSLDSVLERDLAEWRSRALFNDISPFSVTEVHRRGSFALEAGDEPEDLTLDVVNDGGWRATAPWNARLDAGAIGLVISNAIFLRTTTFSDDAPADLAYYGLDPAPLSFSFSTADARTETLRLAPHPDGGDWYCVREGDPHIYRISKEAVLLLISPVDMLVDRDVVRVVRDRITAVRLAGAGREVLLEPVPRGWVVSGRTDAGVELEREPADRARVEELVGELERERVLALLPDVSFPAGPAQGLWIEADGRTLGGSIGPEYTTDDGGTGALFRRDGDGLVSLVSARFLELVSTDPAELRSMSLLEVSELEVARVELSSAVGSRTYVRDSKGRWSRQGTEVEARAFALVVDRLLSLRAREHLAGPEGLSPEAPISVVIKRPNGPEVAYTLDRTGAGQGIFLAADGLALVDGKLWADLTELLQPE